jgi:hypothetical protein
VNTRPGGRKNSMVGEQLMAPMKYAAHVKPLELALRRLNNRSRSLTAASISAFRQ